MMVTDATIDEIRETIGRLNDVSAKLLAEIDRLNGEVSKLRATKERLTAAGQGLAARLMQLAEFAGDHFRGDTEEKIAEEIQAWERATNESPLARPTSVMLRTPGTLSEDERAAIRKDWEKMRDELAAAHAERKKG